jgi:diadenosine tetraphosphate (Ap4A) HIT family hydrolase
VRTQPLRRRRPAPRGSSRNSTPVNGSVVPRRVTALFCRIIAGEGPSTEVLRTPTTFAFRDVDPAAQAHVLVVPIEHITDATEVTSDHGAVLADMVVTAQRVAAQEGVASSGY